MTTPVKVVLFIIGLAILGGIIGGSDSNRSSTSSYTSPSTSTSRTPSAPADNRTMGQRNAQDRAESYLNYTAFSRQGLIDQLEYEGFSHSDAVYAVDHCGANWNTQAGLKAQRYLDYTSFSRQGLIDQLEYEGFSHAQALHGVDVVGY